MSSFSRLYEMFDDQFSGEGDAIVYRRYQKGAAYKVSAEERDNYVSSFKRSMRIAQVTLIAVMLVLTLGLIFTVTVTFKDAPESSVSFGVIVSIVLALIPYAVIYRRAWNAPQVELSLSRMPSAPALSKEAARRNALARLRYSQLVLLPLFSVLLLFPKHGSGVDPLHGWGRLWWLLPVGLTTLAAVQAYRKWQSEKA